MNASRLLSFLLLIGALAGCAGPALSPLEVSRVYPCEVGVAWAAVAPAVEDLDYRPKSNRHDAQGGVLRAWSAVGGDLFVRAAEFTEGTTLISVAAPNGNRDLEEAVLGRIGDRLGPLLSDRALEVPAR